MLKIRNISKSFYLGTPNENKVIDNLSLHLKQGDFVTVIGSNGSGKSTLQNLISGVLYPDSGEIIVGDQNVTNWPEYKRAKYLGRVFQDPMTGTAGDMQIEENLAMAKRRGKTRTLAWAIKNTERASYQEMLKDLNLNLEGRLNSKVKRLSGGQRQAITLLMATIRHPQLLLLDEHTAALDPKTAKTVLDLTQRIVSQQCLTTLMITHNMKDALKYGNRLIMLDKGKIIFDIEGSDKKNLTVSELLKMFEESAGRDLVLNDRLLLG